MLSIVLQGIMQLSCDSIALFTFLAGIRPGCMDLLHPISTVMGRR